MPKTIDGFVIKDRGIYYGICSKTLLPIKTKVRTADGHFWAYEFVVRDTKTWDDKLYKTKKAAARQAKIALAERLKKLEFDLKNTKRKISLVKNISN